MTAPDLDKSTTLALDVMQAALSLAVKRFTEGPSTVTEAEIERAAELFDVGPDEADQIMLLFDLLVAFGDAVSASCRR